MATTLESDVSNFLNDLKKGKSKSDPRGKAKAHSKPKPSKIHTLETIPKIEESSITLPTKITLDPKSKFVFPPTSHWYQRLPPPSSSSSPLNSQTIQSLYEKATRLHSSDVTLYHTPSSSSSQNETSFLTKISKSGTLSDRLSALTLLIQSSPTHNTHALETLRSMAERGKGKGGREEALKALRCVVDWWVGGGAPKGRKLRYWRDLVKEEGSDESLVGWWFEDWLKKYFFSILQILETLSTDPLPYIRTQSLTLLSTLLKQTPEQEQNLLRLLVNKLGDNEKSICSRAAHHLLQLLQTHPNMKGVVVKEVVGLVMRPLASTSAATLDTSKATGNGTNTKIRFSDPTPPAATSSPKKPAPTALTTAQIHARYYAIVTFNQIVLTSSDADRQVAVKLVDVYFELFREVLGMSSKESASKDVDEVEEEEEEVKLDSQGRILDRKSNPKHKKGDKKGGIKAKTQRGAAGFTEIQDSQSKLVSGILTGVNRALPFVKMDLGDVGLQKHIDTLFLITHKSTFNISLQALVLLQQITASLLASSSSPVASSSSTSASTSTNTNSNTLSTSIISRYYQTLYTSLTDPRLLTSSKQAMYLNLFFKSIKALPSSSTSTSSHTSSSTSTSKSSSNSSSSINSYPESLSTIKALIKRFAQLLVSMSGAVEFVAGGLFLLGELCGCVPGVREMIRVPPPLPNNSAKEKDEQGEEEAYDPRKRDPRYAHAALEPLWELTPLLNHYHPSISLHAKQLLQSQPLTASADLDQNTLMHFLDRFVYKNPKKVPTPSTLTSDETQTQEGWGKGGSAMQPSASALEGVKLVKGAGGGEGSGVNVNEKRFWSLNEKSVPVDQVFFHRFFKRREEREEKRGGGKRGGKGDEDEDDEEDDEAEEGESGDEVGGKKGAEVPETDQDEEEDESGSELEEEGVWKAIKASMHTNEDPYPDSGSDDDDDDAEGMDGDSDEVPSDLDDMSSMSDGDIELVGFDDDDTDGDEVNPKTFNAADSDFDEGEGEWQGIQDDSSAVQKSKRKRPEDGDGEEDEKKSKKKKRKALPTFASYEEYAEMVEQE